VRVELPSAAPARFRSQSRALILAAALALINGPVFAQSSSGNMTGANSAMPPAQLPQPGTGVKGAPGAARQSAGPVGIPLGAAELPAPGESAVISVNDAGALRILPSTAGPSPIRSIAPIGGTGIPLGSIQIGNPGIGPLLNPESTSSTNSCTTPGILVRPPLFDPRSTLTAGIIYTVPVCGQASQTGGGATAQIMFRSARGRSGIPLGATELNNPGLSPIPAGRTPRP
jgi:hypothetical protein